MATRSILARNRAKSSKAYGSDDKCISHNWYGLDYWFIKICKNVILRNTFTIFDIVSLNESSGQFAAYESVTVTVNPIDYNGNARSSGWGTYILEVEKFDTSSASMGLTNITMSDNLDGTYSATFTSEYEGSIQYNVYFDQSWTVCAYFYTNTGWTGTYTSIYSYGYVNLDWSNLEVLPGYYDYVCVKFLSKFTTPETTDYIFEAHSDDGMSVKLDGVSYISSSVSIYQNFTVSSFVAGQTYDMEIQYVEYTGNAYVIFKWYYSTVNGEPVPGNANSYVFSTEVIGPYSATVLPPICGNGNRHPPEECDDGNLIELDGCSSACLIEDGYYCSITTSTCSTCPVGYTISSDKHSCSSSILTSSQVTLLLLLKLIIGASSLIGIANSLIANSSNMGMFGFVNAIQMITILPLLAKYMPDRVIRFIKGLNDWLLSFTFLKMDGEWDLKLTGLDSPQNNWYLAYIGLESASALINLQMALKIIMLNIFVTLILIWAKCWFKFNPKVCASDDSKCKFMKRVFQKVHKLYVWNLYVTWIVENCILYALCSYEEVYVFDTSNSMSLLSLSFAWFFTLIQILALLHCLWLWRMLKMKKDWEEGYFGEYFEGLRFTKFALCFKVIYIFRRMLSVAILIFFVELNFIAKFVIYLCLQVIYTVWLILIRPFWDFSQNLNEIICELTYIMLTILLWVLSSQSKWGEHGDTVYIGIIFWNSIVYLFIVFYVMIHAWIKKWWT